MTEPSFPPLFTGEAVRGDPFAAACARAAAGCDAGLITYALDHRGHGEQTAPDQSPYEDK